MSTISAISAYSAPSSARVVQGEAGVNLYGVFLKDYKPNPW
ncbi:hypothetical protein [Microbacterium alcoholitolerans]